MSNVAQVLIAGQWRYSADSKESFRSYNPSTGEALPTDYPVSNWSDCDLALSAADDAVKALRAASASEIACFLENFAARIEAAAAELVPLAHQETALPDKPRLADVELPRTINQMRQAAIAARDGSWSMPTIDTAANIRSMLLPIGPVCVFGPNNFPFAFNSIAGGDFCSAIASGNPVIAKANTSHPGVTKRFAELAAEALKGTDLHPATVQLIYRLSHTDGERLVADPRVGATAYTGSRAAGLALKSAADAAGKPIYLELSSVNPIVMLPGALTERGAQIAEDFAASCMMGGGQFCTNPGIVLLCEGAASEAFIQDVKRRFEAARPATLLSAGVARSLNESVQSLQSVGATRVTSEASINGGGFCGANTLLRVAGAKFLQHPEEFQTEAFGPASLLVVARDVEELTQVIERLEGNLTGCVYSDTAGRDDDAYRRIEQPLRARVGRLLNDKMPTGVAVSAAMNHGGPYPATGHPGFTAVGIPATLRRFGALACYDNVRQDRLPEILKDKSPHPTCWRLIDGAWTTGDATRKA